MENQRTLKQNKSLHKLFGLLAEELNNAGYDMRKTLKPEVEIPWNSKTIKDYLWRPIQKVYLQKESTTELTTKEIDKIYDILCRHLAKLGITTPDFPSYDQQNFLNTYKQ